MRCFRFRGKPLYGNRLSTARAGAPSALASLSDALVQDQVAFTLAIVLISG